MDRFSAHMDRAWDLISKGDTVRALVSAKKAMEIDEESPEVHNLLGYICAMDGDVDEALVNYRQAIVLDDEYVDPVLNTVELLIQSDSDPEEAIRLCRNARQIVRGREELAEAILLEVDALLNLGCTGEAKKALKEIEDPVSLPSAYEMILGRALYEVGEHVAAKQFVDRAIKRDPFNADAWYYLGLIARDEGKIFEAISAFKKVLKLDGESPVPQWSKYLDPIEALVHQAIEELDPDDKAMLKDIEIIIDKHPSERQVLNDVDPRQSVYFDGVDLESRVVSKLWVFTYNLARAGVMPNTAVNDLVKIIQCEIVTPKNQV
jgi:tetratricopeptide (TPR) repeat protein